MQWRSQLGAEYWFVERNYANANACYILCFKGVLALLERCA
jgi:hypothetical protein